MNNRNPRFVIGLLALFAAFGFIGWLVGRGLVF